jgi:hypothetical protein
MKRVRFGIVALLVVDVVAILLVTQHAARPWRLCVFPLMLGAAISLLQVKERTCVANAARGVRNMDDGDKPVTDAGELRQIATQVRRIYVQAAIIAAIFTGVFFFVPF